MKKVMIDPGHGGKDPGAIGPTGAYEADVNLLVAKKVAVLLQPVVSAGLTRKTDIGLGSSVSADLIARSNMANQAGADVFVSIHCNSAVDATAHGTETHCYPGSVKGAVLAQCLQDRLVPALGLTDRGTKESNFAVLRQSKMPAALVELAFISNSVEEKLLQSEDFQDRAALAIAQGICDFLGVRLPQQEMVPLDEQRQSDDIKIVVFGKEFPGVLIGDRAYAPVRDLVSAVGVKEPVTWNPGTRTVIIE